MSVGWSGLNGADRKKNARKLVNFQLWRKLQHMYIFKLIDIYIQNFLLDTNFGTQYPGTTVAWYQTHKSAQKW